MTKFKPIELKFTDKRQTYFFRMNHKKIWKIFIFKYEGVESWHKDLNTRLKAGAVWR